MIWSGFIIGILGSLHCVGMCGPLALAVPTIPGKRLTSSLIFNGGRILTYTVLGGFFGLMGMGIKLAGFQSYLSILTGVFVLSIVFFPSIQHYLNYKFKWDFTANIRKSMTHQLKKKSYGSLFSLGFLNGFLPCGLIYVAIAGALETGYVESAALYMSLFGIGTSIMLILTMLSRDWFSQVRMMRPKRIVPILTFLLGVMFIVRGIIYMIPPEHQELAVIEVMAKITMCHGR